MESIRLRTNPIRRNLFFKTHGKTNLLRLILCAGYFILFASIPAQANPPVGSCESCAIPGITPQTFITGAHAVIYAGRFYNPDQCKTYFFYCIVNDGGSGGHDISHTNFGDLNCSNTCLESISLSSLGEWSVDNNNDIILDGPCGTVEYGTDPTTDICGVKHDEESEGACYEDETCSGVTFRVTHLYLGIEGYIPEGTVTVAIKFGNASESLEIPGPGSCADEGCPPTEPLLAVRFSAFSALKAGETSLLKWTTASETNNDYFEIQRADHTKNFISIGKIKGAGNSNTLTSYEFSDRSPYAGINFYRLRQVDFNNNATLSPIQTVNFNKSLEVLIYPNPTTNEISIRLNEWDQQLKTTFKVLDINGAEVFTEEVKSITTLLDVAQLPIGTYFIQVTNNSTTQAYRFIKS